MTDSSEKYQLWVSDFLPQREDPEDLKVYAQQCINEGRKTWATIAQMEAKRIENDTQQGFTNPHQPIEPSSSSSSLMREYHLRSSAIQAERQSQTPKRILLITNIFPPQELGGIGRKLWEWASELLRRGHTLRILTADLPELSYPPDPTLHHIEHFVERHLRAQADWSTLPPKPFTDASVVIRNSVHNQRTLEECMHRLRPHYCLIGNLDTISGNLVETLARRNIPTIQAIGNATPSYSRYNVPLYPSFRLGPCSHWLGEHLTDQGYNAFPCYPLYSGGLLEKYYHFFPPTFDKLRIAFASLLIGLKAPDVLVNALIRLKKQGIPFECEIAGDHTKDPGLYEHLRSVIQSYKLENEVHFLGLQNSQQLQALFRRSNVLVFPSKFHESFGRAAIEAMAAGLVVVSSGTGGQKEIITHEKNGLLFQNKSADDLATKLTWLQEDRKRWKHLALEAQNRAFEFTTCTTIDRLEEAFVEIAANHSSSQHAAPYNSVLEPIQKMEAVCREVRKRMSDGQLIEAKQKFESIEVKETAPAFYYKTKCLLNMKTNNWDNAFNAAVNAIIQTPDDPEACVYMARLLPSINAHELANTLYEEAIHRAPNHAQLRVEKASLLEKMNRPGQALSQRHLAQALQFTD